MEDDVGIGGIVEERGVRVDELARNEAFLDRRLGFERSRRVRDGAGDQERVLSRQKRRYQRHGGIASVWVISFSRWSWRQRSRNRHPDVSKTGPNPSCVLRAKTNGLVPPLPCSRDGWGET
jgi:hypothetical protein